MGRNCKTGLRGQSACSQECLLHQPVRPLPVRGAPSHFGVGGQPGPQVWTGSEPSRLTCVVSKDSRHICYVSPVAPSLLATGLVSMLLSGVAAQGSQESLVCGGTCFLCQCAHSATLHSKDVPHSFLTGMNLLGGNANVLLWLLLASCIIRSNALDNVMSQKPPLGVSERAAAACNMAKEDATATAHCCAALFCLCQYNTWNYFGCNSK